MISQNIIIINKGLNHMRNSMSEDVENTNKIILYLEKKGYSMSVEDVKIIIKYLQNSIIFSNECVENITEVIQFLHPLGKNISQANPIIFNMKEEVYEELPQEFMNTSAKPPSPQESFANDFDNQLLSSSQVSSANAFDNQLLSNSQMSYAKGRDPKRVLKEENIDRFIKRTLEKGGKKTRKRRRTRRKR